jgi:hypothetical protein
MQLKEGTLMPMPTMTPEERAVELMKGGVTQERVVAAIREAEDEAREEVIEAAFSLAKPDSEIANAIATLRHMLSGPQR